jgi:MFS family permease
MVGLCNLNDMTLSDLLRALFKSMTFLLVFFAGAIGTFPLFVTPFFLPQYTKSLGFDSNVGAGLTAGFSLSSAVGRVLCGLACDRFGALNTLAASQLLTGLSMLAMWPASTTMGPLVVFVIVNGVSNGGVSDNNMWRTAACGKQQHVCDNSLC